MANTGTRRDPLPVYCFKLKLNLPNSEAASAFFKSVSGLKYEVEVTPYKEGGQDKFTHQLAGTTKWSNIVLKRGFAQQSYDLVRWAQGWADGSTRQRITGTIFQLNTDLAEVCSWEFKEGWPCKWELSEFDASKSELSIETLEIAHHGLTFK